MAVLPLAANRGLPTQLDTDPNFTAQTFWRIAHSQLTSAAGFWPLNSTSYSRASNVGGSWPGFGWPTLQGAGVVRVERLAVMPT